MDAHRNTLETGHVGDEVVVCLLFVYLLIRGKVRRRRSVEVGFLVPEFPAATWQVIGEYLGNLQRPLAVVFDVEVPRLGGPGGDVLNRR